MKKLEKQQMKSVVGGSGFLTCLTNCNTALRACVKNSTLGTLAKCFEDYSKCAKSCAL